MTTASGTAGIDRLQSRTRSSTSASERGSSSAPGAGTSRAVEVAASGAE